MSIPNPIIQRKAYQDLIADAERRIGSYIASGGSSDDQYVLDQVTRIREWTSELAELERR